MFHVFFFCGHDPKCQSPQLKAKPCAIAFCALHSSTSGVFTCAPPVPGGALAATLVVSGRRTRRKRHLVMSRHDKARVVGRELFCHRLMTKQSSCLCVNTISRSHKCRKMPWKVFSLEYSEDCPVELAMETQWKLSIPPTESIIQAGGDGKWI